MKMTSSLNVVVRRVDGIGCLLSVAIDRSVEPNRTGKTNQEIVAQNSKQNTPGHFDRTSLKYKRKRQVIFDTFYKI